MERTVSHGWRPRQSTRISMDLLHQVRKEPEPVKSEEMERTVSHRWRPRHSTRISMELLHQTRKEPEPVPAESVSPSGQLEDEDDTSCPPCVNFVDFDLPCGHTVLAECSRKTAEVKCDKQCNRKRPVCGHACSNHPCDDPCPPCENSVFYQADCGHRVQRMCHQDDPTKDPEYKCQRPCRRSLKCGHDCQRKCSEECGPCNLPTIWHTPECQDKSHWNIGICSVVSRLMYPSLEPTLYETLGKMKFNSVERIGEFLNGMNANFTEKEVANMLCEIDCDAMLECGHPCSGTCGQCFGGMFHVRCKQKCDRFLICGHPCKEPCGNGCPPCSLPCTRSCDHDAGPSKNKCDKPCGAPCNWKCDKICPYECPHGFCNLQCDQICNMSPCVEPCPKLLHCGHPCVGFCGELCPPICRICNKETLSDGCLLTGEVEDDDKFIYLEGCGHSIESQCLEQFVNVEYEDNEIVLIRCPLCREPLRWIPRFSEVFNRNWEAVNQVKERCWGDPIKIEETLGEIRELLEQVDLDLVADIEPGFFSKFVTVQDPGERHKMTIQIADSLKWCVSELGEASRQISKLSKYPVFTPLGEEAYAVVIDQWTDLLGILTRIPKFPVQPHEMKSYEAAKQYVMLRTRFFDVIYEKTRAPKLQLEIFLNLMTSKKGQSLFFSAKNLLGVSQRCPIEDQEEATECLRAFAGHVSSSVDLSEEDRKQLVAAFPGGPGRWFKCQNGHVYVITECGGAMSQSVCPECNERIGGEHHRLAEDNFIAQEMDGAEIGMYDRRVQENLQLRRERRGRI